ncbi:YtxH domain-containing protein [Brumimicrobium sp.]|uniref:YtxH domain-containing protein n=1 Tax=Brumimicrobium sp. TaxID=2029867 RepID=UPI002628C68A|nr:YtxH domain-containing protein [uncultured Brumimicrobium sp.]
MGDTSKIIAAALAGAVVGAGVALLLAPASGKETREKIADKLGDAKDAISDKGEELLKKAKAKS